jgi:hypothetical protein
MTQTKVNATNEDRILIQKIVARAKTIRSEVVVDYRPIVDIFGLAYALTIVHLNTCPIDLQRLLEADDANFLHDILGIQRHIDMSTGELRDCFLPRFAVNQ